MKLNKIRIRDFRSILDQTIEFNENCLGLIGLNESGKSNVLSAIRILEKDHVVTNSDKCKITKKFPSLDLEFSVDEHDLVILVRFFEAFVNSIKTSQAVAYTLENQDSINKAVRVVKEGEVIKIDIFYQYPVSMSIDFPLLQLGPNATFPPETFIQADGGNILLKDINLIDPNLVPDDLKIHFLVYTEAEFDKMFGEWLHVTFPKMSPSVIFWEYDKKYLVPSEITYGEFTGGSGPYQNSAPLYNIFLLCKQLGIKTTEDLNTKIATWKTDSSEGRRDGAIITTTINKYIRNIWADYDQELKIELEENKITIHINDPKSEEKNYYAMEARSQGFKTFISFILTIAAEAENGIIDNYILLLDEPETHLHPSGVRYMKRELLNMSQKNYIIFSTHSIFMIDRENLARHVKVKKDDEITRLTKVERNNFIQEAVIYEAMGTRIDEFSFGAINTIVEGDLDYTLLEFYISLNESEIHKNFKDSKIYNGGGTKQIKEFLNSKILPPDSIWNIILDNDAPAQELIKKSKEFYAKQPHMKLKLNFYHYSNTNLFELEDILPRELIKEAFDNTIKLLSLPNEHQIDLGDVRKVVSALTNEFVNRPPLPTDQKSKFEETFKGETSKLVYTILDEIKKLPDLPARVAMFNSKLPKYSEALAKIVLKPVATPIVA